MSERASEVERDAIRTALGAAQVDKVLELAHQINVLKSFKDFCESDTQSFITNLGALEDKTTVKQLVLDNMRFEKLWEQLFTKLANFNLRNSPYLDAIFKL